MADRGIIAESTDEKPVIPKDYITIPSEPLPSYFLFPKPRRIGNRKCYALKRGGSV